MADYSGMPPLVDGPSEAAQPGNYHSHAGRTPYLFPAAPPSASAMSTPWSGTNQLGWSPYAQPAMMSSWPSQPSQQWPGAFVMTPAAFPALAPPAITMQGPADSWPQRPEEPDQDWVRVSQYINGEEDNLEGWPITRTTSRPHTPFSSSNTSSPSSFNSHISRSRSLRSVHDENTKRPPREWRADFNMGRSLGLGASLGSMFTKARSASISGSILDSPRASKLNPYIRYSAVSPAMHLDLRKNPSTLRFRALDREVNPWDLTRFACEPPVAVMRVYNSHYPWHIDVESSNPAGVTLHDLFSAIWLSMMTPIAHADWWNNEMDEITRERIARSWAERCVDDGERQKGVRRVDFLMDRCILLGLEKGRDSMWEMKVKRQ